MTALRLLLVEDHFGTAQALARLLIADGYRVDLADTLADAKRLCQMQRFDLLICDLELPDGDGTELLKELAHPTAAIALSGYDTKKHRQAAAAAGFIDFIAKPVPYDRIRQAIDRATGRIPPLPVSQPVVRGPGP